MKDTVPLTQTFTLSTIFQKTCASLLLFLSTLLPCSSDKHYCVPIECPTCARAQLFLLNSVVRVCEPKRTVPERTTFCPILIRLGNNAGVE